MRANQWEGGEVKQKMEQNGTCSVHENVYFSFPHQELQYSHFVSTWK